MFGLHCCKKLREIWDVVACTHRDVIKLLKWIALKKIDFVQLHGDIFMPTNFTIVAGTKGSFGALLTPPNGATSGVPAWSASDASVTLTPSADGLSCDADVPVGNTAPFDLTLSATSSDSTVGTVSKAHTISVLPPPPPPLQSVDFQQTA